MLLKRKLNESACLYHQQNQSIHVTEGMTVTSLSASVVQKISLAADHLCQMVLNQKLSHKFEEWSKFSSCIKAKSGKRKSRK
jgi:2-hydroxy-3-keto-5-methylthiopentenyl-1-phosphate phosphatase